MAIVSWQEDLSFAVRLSCKAAWVGASNSTRLAQEEAEKCTRAKEEAAEDAVREQESGKSGATLAGQ